MGERQPVTGEIPKRHADVLESYQQRHDASQAEAVRHYIAAGVDAECGPTMAARVVRKVMQMAGVAAVMAALLAVAGVGGWTMAPLAVGMAIMSVGCGVLTTRDEVAGVKLTTAPSAYRSADGALADGGD